LEHERISTTVAKARELRPFVEKLITLARDNSLHSRRLVMARLGGKKTVIIKEGETEKKVNLLQKLFEEIAPRYKDRPGGYTRIVKRAYYRLGDAGPTAFIELLKAGEVKVGKKEPVAPNMDASS
jgi:large subunit ribosomal protein L17